jgi:hypothetical protein
MNKEQSTAYNTGLLEILFYLGLPMLLSLVYSLSGLLEATICWDFAAGVATSLGYWVDVLMCYSILAAITIGLRLGTQLILVFTGSILLLIDKDWRS